MPTDPSGEDRIEELLSQLQGIFGRLSQSEEEELKEKVTPPASPPPTEAASEPAPPPETSPASSVETPPAAPVPEVAPSASEAATFLSASEMPPTAAPAPDTAALYQSGVPDQSAIQVAIFYPQGRETEAHTLARKLEALTPKFMKVALQLTVRVLSPYNPKEDWKQTVLMPDQLEKVRGLFLVMERALDDERRKAFAAEFEARGIYFQDVPLISIERKAFYTDLLLGMVFFFDAHKPRPTAT
jgi:hypothetical protein